MSVRTQTLLLIGFILLSIFLTRPASDRAVSSEPPAYERQSIAVEVREQNLSYERAALLSQTGEGERAPVRRWDVFEPQLTAQAILIQSLDDNFPFLRINTVRAWPVASLTKILTALVVKEEIGLNKKIPISDTAVKTLGESGGLIAGDIYTSQDLLKIMLLVSSNDAAVAFEEYLGGNNAAASLLNKKAERIGMTHTILHDGSGLSDLNQSTAEDLFKLIKYIVENEPEVFSWTRLSSFTVQPINGVESHMLLAINGFVKDERFLGGKTGTSDTAQENFIAVFTFHGRRIAFVLLGSKNREQETNALLQWVEKAYEF